MLCKTCFKFLKLGDCSTEFFAAFSFLSLRPLVLFELLVSSLRTSLLWTIEPSGVTEENWPSQHHNAYLESLFQLFHFPKKAHFLSSSYEFPWLLLLWQDDVGLNFFHWFRTRSRTQRCRHRRSLAGSQCQWNERCSARMRCASNFTGFGYPIHHCSAVVKYVRLSRAQHCPQLCLPDSNAPANSICWTARAKAHQGFVTTCKNKQLRCPAAI